MSGYLAYLLRLWHIQGAGESDWRASLEDPHNGEMLGFPNVEALIDHIRELVGNYHCEGETIQESEPRK